MSPTKKCECKKSASPSCNSQVFLKFLCWAHSNSWNCTLSAIMLGLQFVAVHFKIHFEMITCCDSVLRPWCSSFSHLIVLHRYFWIMWTVCGFCDWHSRIHGFRCGMHYCCLKWWRPLLYRPFPFLPDWFRGLSDYLMFLFCSTAGFGCSSTSAFVVIVDARRPADTPFHRRWPRFPRGCGADMEQLVEISHIVIFTGVL